MAKKGKESIWNDAINKKHEEAEKRREASDFFSEIKPKKNKNTKEDATMPVLKEEIVKTEVVEKEVLKYTSQKPFKNLEGRDAINSHDDVLEHQALGDKSSIKKWSIFGVIFSAVLSAIILIPLIVLAALGALLVDDVLTMRELLGYEVNVTKFAVKHEESNTYLQTPTYEGEQLILGEDKIDTFMFVDSDYFTTEAKKGIPNYSDLWLNSEMIFNGREMNVSFKDGVPVWSGVDEDSTIHLNKKDEGVNQFSISLNNQDAFIAKDDNSNRLILSKNPDWFSFETEVDFIKTTSDYILDYTKLNEGLIGYNPELELGVEGNPISLYSTNSGLYLNSYKDINHLEFPFFLTTKNEYVDSLSLESETDTNLFIQSNSLGEMALSAYQTLPFERYATSEWQKYHPIITANADDTITLNSYDLSQYSEVSMEGTEISNAQFWLLPNPNNLREKAIYFPEVGKFLTTANGELGLREITTEEQFKDLDFFIITHSPNVNPEYTEIEKAATIGGVRENIVARTKNKNAIDGYEFYGYGYESLLQLTTDPSSYYTEVREKADCTKTRSLIKLRDLEEYTTYHGVLATYRNADSGVGKHVTFTYVPPFTTSHKGIDWPTGWPSINWPNIDWPGIDWPTLPIIDPGDPIIDGGKGDPTTAEIWDSTDEVNSGNPVNDVPEEEMLLAASNKIEVTVKVTQGTQDGITKDLGVRLQETDEAGNVVAAGYDLTQKIGKRPITDEEYSFIFDGLEPETNYLATVVYYDGNTAFEQEQSSPLELDYGETQMKATTERVAPSFIEEETSYNWDSDGSGFSVYGVMNDLRDTDEIIIRLENNRSGDVETTGWIKVADWETAAVPDWTLSHNTRPNGEYYEATCNSAISLDSYDVNMWVRMDTSNDFLGWDETSPAFDQNYTDITSESAFDVIEIFNMVGITADKQHIIK